MAPEGCVIHQFPVTYLAEHEFKPKFQGSPIESFLLLFKKSIFICFLLPILPTVVPLQAPDHSPGGLQRHYEILAAHHFHCYKIAH